jgi:hypothetical protein
LLTSEATTDATEPWISSTLLPVAYIWMRGVKNNEEWIVDIFMIRVQDHRERERKKERERNGQHIGLVGGLKCLTLMGEES